MEKKPSLRQLLLKSVLPRLSGLIIIIAGMLFMLTVYFGRVQINDFQHASLEGLTQDLAFITEDTSRQLADLAANDIIINALIDTEQRENYLPMFFRSLNLTQARNVSFALYDFSGVLVIQKSWPSQLPNTLEQAWREPTLLHSQPYHSITEHGVLLSVPVLLNGMAEGALVMYVSSLQPLLASYPRLTEQVVTDKNNAVLFSSDDALTEGGFLKYTKHTSDYVVVSQEWEDLKLYSIRPFEDAFAGLKWLALVIFAMLVGTLLINLHIITVTGTHAQQTLRGLYDNILLKVKNRGAIATVAPKNEAMELSQIRTSFDNLIASLTEMTLSNEQLSNVMDSMGDMLIVVDNAGNVLLCNRQFDTFCEQHQDGHEATVSRLVSKLHNKREGELKYTDRSNHVSRIKWRVSTLLDEGENTRGKIYVGNDVTAQRALESHVQVLTHAIDEATVSIVISDITQPSQPVIYSNYAFSQLTGFSKEEIIGLNCAMLQGGDTENEIVGAISSAIKQRFPIETTLLNYRKDGTPFYNNLILTPVQIDGEVTHYIGIQQDVTQQKQAEAFLQDAKHKAEESARMKSGFLASMSHEIRTPIHGISGVLQLLQNSPLSEQQRHYLALATYSIESLLHIVNDILDFSKIEAGHLQIENHPFLLLEELEAIQGQFTVLCRDKGLALRFNNEFDTALWVSGDAVRYRQILTNLIGNAVKFTEVGSIEVTTKIEELSNGALCLACDVRDTGIGIAKEKQGGIFDVFTQEDLSTTRKFGGTGLGLSICKQLCVLMQGDIALVSDKGLGSTFSFTILLSKGDGSVGHSLEVTRNKNRTTKRKILIVEDNEINQTIVKEHLKAHITLSAHSGVEALEALNQTKATFDIILMDCQMPEMDGFEASTRIRNGEAGVRYRHIPIIALTANAMKGDKVACYEAGMDDYLSKPFDVEDLLDKIDYWSTNGSNHAKES